MRICAGANHAEGCHHEQYLRDGVERLLSHPRTLEAMTLALSQERPIHPDVHAKRILLELARVSEQLDSLVDETYRAREEAARDRVTL